MLRTSARPHPKVCRSFRDSTGMPHMGSPTSPLCSTAVSSLMPISCARPVSCTPQAEPSSTGGEFFQYALLRAEMGRFLPLASYVLQGPRFHPSCWVTSIWPLPPGCWGKRGSGRKAMSLEEEMQKLRGYLHFMSSGCGLGHRVISSLKEVCRCVARGLIKTRRA